MRSISRTVSLSGRSKRLTLFTELGRGQRVPTSYLQSTLGLTEESSYEDAQAAGEEVARAFQLGDVPGARLADRARDLPSDAALARSNASGRREPPRPQLFNREFVQRVRVALDDGTLSFRRAAQLLNLDTSGLVELIRSYGIQPPYEAWDTELDDGERDLFAHAMGRDEPPPRVLTSPDRAAVRAAGPGLEEEAVPLGPIRPAAHPVGTPRPAGARDP